MSSNPYARAASAYRSAIQTLPPVKGVAALLDRALQHCAAAEPLLKAGRYDRFHDEIRAAITILSGLSQFVAGQMPADAAVGWGRQCGGLVVALGRIAGGPDPRERLHRCHDRLARLRQSWGRAAGLDTRAEPLYAGARPASPPPAVDAAHG
ncbi:flagellar protein FliS [Oleisolibacter albus]|uniref:flagellar protein FliS n=1 Tax=Oleisolibacter albus TaxID=2171757 RepID=UPI000DF2DDC7|nr:flagellar protein FliS [Oleisolibacter albus]